MGVEQPSFDVNLAAPPHPFAQTPVSVVTRWALPWARKPPPCPLSPYLPPFCRVYSSVIFGLGRLGISGSSLLRMTYSRQHRTLLQAGLLFRVSLYLDGVSPFLSSFFLLSSPPSYIHCSANLPFFSYFRITLSYPNSRRTSDLLSKNASFLSSSSHLSPLFRLGTENFLFFVRMASSPPLPALTPPGDLFFFDFFRHYSSFFFSDESFPFGDVSFIFFFLIAVYFFPSARGNALSPFLAAAVEMILRWSRRAPSLPSSAQHRTRRQNFFRFV